MLQSRWSRRSAVVFAAMLMSLVGLVTPASADGHPVAVEFTPHCSNNILKFTNGLDTTMEVRGLVDGTPTAWVSVDAGLSRTIGVRGTAGDEVEAQYRVPPDTAAVTLEASYTYQVPARCDDFDVAFVDSCEGTTVSVVNLHSDVYLRIYAPALPTVVHQGDFNTDDLFIATYPMSPGDKMIVEITFGAGGLIDTVAEHTYAQPRDCGSEPEFPATIEDTCTGVKVTVTNDSDEAFSAEVIRVAASAFESLLEFEVPAGETKTVEVVVEDGTEILVSSGDLKRDLARHTVDLKDCPDLPKTGTDVMTIVLAGLGVLVVGAGVLFGLRLARRRRLTEQ